MEAESDDEADDVLEAGTSVAEDTESYGEREKELREECRAAKKKLQNRKRYDRRIKLAAAYRQKAARREKYKNAPWNTRQRSEGIGLLVYQ